MEDTTHDENLLRYKQKDRLHYGFGRFQPKHLQKLNRPIVFLAFVSFVLFGYGFAAIGLNNVVLTTIERRYGFTSTKIAMFSLCHNVVSGLLSIQICYMGHKHRPVAIAIGCSIVSLGLFVISLPHFISPPYNAGVAQSTDTCRFNSTLSSDCQRQEEYKNNDNDINVFPIFLLGYALVGTGVTPLYSLGLAHIEEITSRKESSVYFAILSIIGFFGPAGGFVAGNPILNVYVDIEQVSMCVHLLLIHTKQYFHLNPLSARDVNSRYDDVVASHGCSAS
jgi:Organic Anion Transporter Polypeptide (OATP) family.